MKGGAVPKGPPGPSKETVSAKFATNLSCSNDEHLVDIEFVQLHALLKLYNGQECVTHFTVCDSLHITMDTEAFRQQHD